MRRSLIILFALVAGLGTVLLLERLRPAPPEPEVVAAQSDTVGVLVYAGDMPRGTALDESSLRWQEQLRSAVPPEAVISENATDPIPELYLNRPVRRDILGGEWVRASDLLDRGAGFMALTVTPGMRAVGLAVNDEKLAGGFILPDDRIDLIHTSNGDFNEDGRSGSFSQTILANIRVLAIGERPTSRITFRTPEQQAAAAQQTNDIVMKGGTITLEMSDREAEILFAALASGQVSLALRSVNDHGPSQIMSVLGFETRNSPPPPPQPVVVEAPTPDPAVADPVPEPQPAVQTQTTPVRQTIRIISGGSASTVDVPPAPARGSLEAPSR